MTLHERRTFSYFKTRCIVFGNSKSSGEQNLGSSVWNSYVTIPESNVDETVKIIFENAKYPLSYTITKKRKEGLQGIFKRGFTKSVRLNGWSVLQQKHCRATGPPE